MIKPSPRQTCSVIIGSLANQLLFDDQIVLHAKNIGDSVCENVHRVVIAAVGNVTFEFDMAAIDNDPHGWICPLEIAE